MQIFIQQNTKLGALCTVYWAESIRVQVADTKDNYRYMSLSRIKGSFRGCLVGVLLCMCESITSVLYVYNRTIVSLHEPATPWKG